MASSSSTPSSTITLPKKYDVFLSFRGPDTRVGFTGHLNVALSQKYMVTFIDNRLERGDGISTALLKSIQESKIAVVIFSKDYASSTWCLRELAEIMKCKKLNELIVLPVFYYVDPSDVRWQTGPFQHSFDEHKNKSQEEVQEWREAFTEASNLSGWHYDGTRDEAELVRDIVEDVQNKLMSEIENISPPLSDFEGLIGIHKRIERVMSLLCLDTMDVRIIGIWGMGGIGKTTLAEAVFNRISGKFDGVCFKRNVRETIEKHGSLDSLVHEVLSKVLDEGNLKLDTHTNLHPFIKERLNRKKVLIVFDDVNNFLQLETLVEVLNRCGLGSRMIMTSRNKQVLNNFVDDHDRIYGVDGLDRGEALELFRKYAFKKKHPAEDLTVLSIKILYYAEGNPLALKVLGSSLQGKSKQEWESAFDNLHGIGDSQIFDVLKISYDGLNDEEKTLFLDIACFFNGYLEDNVAKLLDCKYSLSVLVDKSLITIEHKFIKMHDLLQEMGREIVRKESPKNPGKRSRLWKPNDVIRTLKNNTGTEEVEGISLNMGNLEDVHLNLSCQVFVKMPNLRLLLFTDDLKFDDDLECDKVHLSNGLNSLPNDLIVLRWHLYPLRVLPSNFSLEKLVDLDLCHSNIERLWEGTMHAPKLKRLILRFCRHLTRIPNLSGFLALEEVDLRGCKNLVEFPSSAQQLNKLRYLYLGGCSNVTKFPLTSASIEGLYLSGTAIEEVPSSIQSLTNLESLACFECRGLTILPPLSGLRSLTKLYLKNCNLMEIPEDIGCLSSLEWLDLRGNMFESLPKSIKHLSKLQTLLLRDCNMLRSLTELPVALQQLDAINCTQLCQVFGLNCSKYLEFSFINCFSLDQKAVSDVFEESLKGYEEPPTQVSIYLPGNKIPEWFSYQSFGSSINIEVLRRDLVNRKLLGFAICAVLWIEEFHDDYNYLGVYISCHFETCDGRVLLLPFNPNFPYRVFINLAHIILGYFSFSEFLPSLQNLEMLPDSECDYVDITFKFKGKFEYDTDIEVICCAVHPIYA